MSGIPTHQSRRKFLLALLKSGCFLAELHARGVVGWHFRAPFRAVPGWIAESDPLLRLVTISVRFQRHARGVAHSVKHYGFAPVVR